MLQANTAAMQLKYLSMLNMRQSVWRRLRSSAPAEATPSLRDEDAQGTALAVTCVLDMAIEKAKRREEEIKKDNTRVAKTCTMTKTIGLLTINWEDFKRSIKYNMLVSLENDENILRESGMTTNFIVTNEKRYAFIKKKPQHQMSTSFLNINISFSTAKHYQHT
jgi:hypothetical protein